MNIEQFISNDAIKNELADAMLHRTVPHAVIIEGAKGTGKRTLAQIIAASAVCTSQEQHPCGICSGCLKAQQGIHPDIFIADGNSTGGISISIIRQIRSDAYIKPNEAPTRVFMLFNCDKMLAPAQNAFLKILEEPPANVMFILTVTSANMLLETVRSRSRIYSLFPADTEEAAAYLSGVFPDKSAEELKNAVSASGGNIGQAIERIQNGGEESRLLAEEIITAVTGRDEYRLLTLTNQLTKDRQFAGAVLNSMLELSHECLKAAIGVRVHSAAAEEVSAKLSKRRCYAMTEVISNACGILNTNVNLAFFSTWLCAQLSMR